MLRLSEDHVKKAGCYDNRVSCSRKRHVTDVTEGHQILVHSTEKDPFQIMPGPTDTTQHFRMRENEQATPTWCQLTGDRRDEAMLTHTPVNPSGGAISHPLIGQLLEDLPKVAVTEVNQSDTIGGL